MTTPSPASLRQLAGKTFNLEIPLPGYALPPPKEIEEVREALRAAADRIEELEKEDLYVAIQNYARRHLEISQQLDAAQSEARFQKERADGYSGWVTEFEKREARLRGALEKIYAYRSDKPDWNMVMAIAEDAINPMVAIPSALDGEGENE